VKKQGPRLVTTLTTLAYVYFRGRAGTPGGRQAAPSFIQEHVSQIKTGPRISSLLRRDVIAYWGTKSIHEIKKRDVSELVSLIAQRNAVASHRMLKTLKTFFRWCVGRAVIDFSPAEGISSNYRENPSRPRAQRQRARRPRSKKPDPCVTFSIFHPLFKQAMPRK
jgi:hypothetical protein